MAADGKTIRSFIAIDLPEEVKEGIRLIQGRIKPRLEQVRWVRPENIHMTLKFLGDVEQSIIEPMSEGMTEVMRREEPLSFSVGGIGGFPRADRARVVWLGVRGDIDRLAVLQSAIEGFAESFGVAREKRSFRPHLTIGRTRSGPGMITGLEKVQRSSDVFEAGSFVAEGVTFFQSILKSDGAVYRELAYFPFNR